MKTKLTFKHHFIGILIAKLIVPIYKLLISVKIKNSNILAEIHSGLFIMSHQNILAALLSHKAFTKKCKHIKASNCYFVISPSGEGKFAIACAHKLGYNTLDGSTNRNPIKLTKTIIDTIGKNKMVYVFADGSRGPLREISDSLVKIAQKVNTNIYNSELECDSIELSSWDKHRIIKPFSKMVWRIRILDNKNFDEIKNCLKPWN